MGVRNFTSNDMVQVKRIIGNINSEKNKIVNFNRFFIDEDRCIGLILSSMRKFYGGSINEGVYVAILNDRLIRNELMNIFLKIENCF